MQFHPRVRSRDEYARIRNWPASRDAKPLGFAGYKVGMTHIMIVDNKPTSMTKNQEIFCPVTVVECPPIKVASIKFYKNSQNGPKLASELYSDALDKELDRKIVMPKKSRGKEAQDYDYVRLFVYTQPKLTNLGKKKPETFEVADGGNKEQQMAYAKEKLGKEISITEVFKPGQLIDAHSVTTGKGTQGPMRRFGIQLRHHKSEKSRRNPGSLGAWRAQGHIMWRVAHAGKMGYHLRTEYNKLVLRIGNKPEEINVKGGYLDYGNVKNSYILVKGSLKKKKKRIIRLTEAIRPKSRPQEPEIAYVSLESKQGR